MTNISIDYRFTFGLLDEIEGMLLAAGCRHMSVIGYCDGS